MNEAERNAAMDRLVAIRRETRELEEYIGDLEYESGLTDEIDDEIDYLRSCLCELCVEERELLSLFPEIKAAP